MEAPIAPAPPIPLAPKPRSTLGSLAVATLAGALIAITALYFWGAQVASEEGLSGGAAQEAR